MQELVDGLILYHGSYCEVSSPQLSKCAKRKDFGKGFYLTSSREQAVSFLKTSIIKAEVEGVIKPGQEYGVISTFKVRLNHRLSSYIFQSADTDWLHCIAAHRKKNAFTEVEKQMAQYDVIGGKVADDATNRTLAAYISGAFGKLGSKTADDFCIGQLLPDRLKDQYCFKTEKALECLHFVEGEKIWLKK